NLACYVVEANLLESRPGLVSGIGDLPSAARETRQHTGLLRGRDWLRFPSLTTRFFINRYSPEIHDATPVTCEVNITPVGRAGRVPVEVTVIDNRNLLLRRGHASCPDRTPARFGQDSPIGYSLAMR